ncbi:MAG: hypothetical protein U0903_05975 [Planctomycetales bacterium]
MEERQSQTGRMTPGVWGIFAFTMAYMGVAVIASIRYQNSEFKLYIVVMTVLITSVLLVHRSIGLNIATLLGLSIWGGAHMAGGLVQVPDSWTVTGASRVLYNWWVIPGLLKFDQLVHANGFGLVTWICWQGLAGAFRRRGVEVRPTFGLLTLCVAGGMGFGAANEVIEFIATKVLPQTNVGGYENTGWDLVSNLVGSVLVVIGIAVFESRRGREGSGA